MGHMVAIIGCVDTKEEEMAYLYDRLLCFRLIPFVVDTSIRAHGIPRFTIGLSANEILHYGAYTQDTLQKMGKSERMDALMHCLPLAMIALYNKGMIQGGIAAGGLQNSLLASTALRALPFGVPKVLISSMANSYLSTEMFTGRSDLVLFPSVADVVGMNPITQVVFNNACAAMAGMVNEREKFIPTSSGKPLVAITCAGVTDKGVNHIAKGLSEKGFTCVLFHGVTGGSYAMENLALEGCFAGILDLNMHDLLVETLGYYAFVHNAETRLKRLSMVKLPTVFSFSGLDTIDMQTSFYESEQWHDKTNRKVFEHNANIRHVKINASEACRIGMEMSKRLNEYDGFLGVVAPLRGFRDNTAPGEALYDPDIDRLLIETVRKHMKPSIPWVTVDCNANDPAFGNQVVEMWLSLYQSKSKVAFVPGQ